MTWTRRLDPDYTGNPAWIDDGDPDYRIRIEHVVPQPVPAGVTQFVQVVKQMVFVVDKNCKVTFRTKYFIDLVDLGGRTTIDDLLTFSRKGLDDCLVVELCEHTVGFGAKNKKFETLISAHVSEATAKEALAIMTAPITTFTTSYIYSRGDCCPDLVTILFFGLQLPRLDHLYVDGIGQFPAPAAPPPPPSSPQPPPPPPPPPPQPPPPPPPPPPLPPPPPPPPPPDKHKQGALQRKARPGEKQ